MSRIINPSSAGKERTRITRAIALAVRELAKKQTADTESRDLAAFIALALESVFETIEPSVAAWEKRNYWLKADRFRMEWRWTGQLAAQMREALFADDWQTVAQIAMQVAMKLQKIKISDKHRMGRPWSGSWEKLQKKSP
jgi:hypothetical protein